MNGFKLASTVVLLILSTSSNVTLTERLSGTTNNTDQSLVLFMPAKNLITTDIVTSNEEGC